MDFTEWKASQRIDEQVLINHAEFVKNRLEMQNAQPITKSTRQQLEELFRVAPGSDNDLTQHNILILCKEFEEIPEDVTLPRYVLLQCDKNIYLGSHVCKKNSKIITKAEIVSIPLYDHYIIGTDLLSDSQLVLIFPEPKEYFLEGFFETVQDFYYYLLFADKYMLNLHYICNRMDKMLWLLSIKERQKDLWRSNALLLTNVEQSIFNKNKFTGSPAPPAAAATAYSYPTGGSNTQIVPRFTSLNQIITPEFISSEDVVNMIEILLRNGVDDFVSKFITILGSSIEYYPVIITNKNLIKLIKSLKPFNSIMFYALRIAFLEELSMYHKKHKLQRFVIDLDTVSLFPQIDIHFSESPYLSTVLQNVSYRSNLTLPAMYNGTRGVYSMNEFNKRLSLFTDDVFKYISWKTEKSTSALSGSIITACAIKTPFEKFFDSTKQYFAEYYPSKQNEITNVLAREKIDYNSLFTFVDNYDSGDDDKNNSSDDENDVSDQQTDDKDNSDEVKHNIDYTDMDLMIACEWEWFDDVAEQHFQAIKRAVDELMPGVKLTFELVDTENKHKYSIKGLPRDIDIFHVDDIPSVIIKYHLGCVRAWYDGNTVWCFPSFITSAMTGINVDIRWTSNKKDVRDIVLKYFQRGFGTLLNSKDKQNLINYVHTQPEWPSINPPPGLQYWRLNDYLNQPLFHNRASAMFNPSKSRYGIHKYIYSKTNTIHLSGYENIRYGRWRRRRAMGDTGDSAPWRCDFKAKRKSILPANCESLAPYM